MSINQTWLLNKNRKTRRHPDVQISVNVIVG